MVPTILSPQNPKTPIKRKLTRIFEYLFDIGSLSEANNVDIKVAFFGALSISPRLDGSFSISWNHEGWNPICLLVYLNFRHVSVRSLPVSLFGDIDSFGLVTEAHFGSGSKISLFESIKFHTVTNKHMMRETSLVEFYVCLIISILLLVKNILLSSLWDIVAHKRVTLVILGLVLSNSSSCWLLYKLQIMH